MSNHAKLMVLDDDFILRRLIIGVAEHMRFKTLGVQDAARFREAFDGFCPDVVTLDLALGDEDGVEILHFMAKQKHTPAVLLISGFDQRVLNSTVRVGEALGLRMLPPLQKPVRADALAVALKELVKAEAPITPEAITQGLAKGELFLNFQPKVHLPTRKLTGVEALIRWRRPDQGIIPPDAFIPIAERAEVIHPLTAFVFDEALRAQARWLEAGLDLSVAVNVSAHSIEDDSFPDQLHRRVLAAGREAGKLTIEVTETTAMTDVDAITSVLTRMRIKGFHLSLDDFGTGYSSLVELYRMPFSELKIDKSFVYKLDTDTDARNIVQAMIGLAHNLGLKAVAEGIETKAVLDALIEMGCDYAQGYYISRPRPAEDLLEWAPTWS
ncbi:EAL domain-containing response regulator [Myxococcota bacterium]|nr:EAL domain-containing response regulator [Myxococcota bacterium]MBU1431018.1 EAL domain-containing response regulator [Myxococcota bacterium]MBU1898991.1 EAL domain-containing response regulator [Myxococcota bacterium]